MALDTMGIDDILFESGIISTAQLKRVWEIQRETKKDLESVLLENEFVTSKDILVAKAKKAEVEFIELSQYEIADLSVINILNENIVNRYRIIPLKKDGDVLAVAMKDPTDIFALDDMKLATGLEILPFMAEGEEIEKLIKKYYVHEAPAKPKRPANDEVISTKGSHDDKFFKDLTSKEDEDDSRFSLSKGKIGDLLVSSGILSQEQLNDALKTQASDGGRVGELLVKKGYITKDTLYEFLEKQMGVPHVNLEEIEISAEVVKMVSENIARRYMLVPIEKDGFMLKVAMSDPLNIFSLDDLRLATGMEITPMLSDADQINAILDKHYEKHEANKKASEHKKKILDMEEEIKKVNQEIAVEIQQEQKAEEVIDISDVENAPIVKMVNIIFNRAVSSGASDIHIEPYEDSIVVRNRIDGQLVETMKHDRKILSALVARVKILSGLNIAEKRIPQDGRITLKIENKNYDMRVSVLPTMFGEKIVIRIADKEGFNVSKDQLGFFEDDLKKFDEILANPHGIVLVTGPTGSGKSTTLYTALKELSKPNVNILTVEDPVECTVKGVNQVQVNVKAGLTFASALRSFLRQDPDIIMVGEIRDGETAEIATRAAITGHLVLSTLHTNDAASSINRMIDMGIEPFMISSSLVGIVAQRLVRRLCPKCKTEAKLSKNEREILNANGDESIEVYDPCGCNECNHTGYKGRIAIYEILNVSRGLRELIAKNVTSDKMKELAIKEGMKTLRENCIRLVKSGVTSIEEMVRVTYTKE